jgi:hypothetical protein
MRKDVLGITPLDMKNMNDNFKYIWLKVFGNLNTADLMDRAVTGDKIAYETVTADNIAVDTLYVGTGGIRIDSTASITWEQVDTTNAPTLIQNIDVNEQRAVFDALTDYGNVRGLFMQNGDLYINADYIAAGVITGCTIQTANYDDYIVLEDQYLQIYHNDSPYVRLAHDMDYDGSYTSYLQLKNVYMLNNAGQLVVSIYSSTVFSVDSFGNCDVIGNMGAKSISTVHDADIGGDLSCYNLEVYGTKNAKVKTTEYGDLLLNADESPNIVFCDRGNNTIGTDGACIVYPDPMYLATVYTKDRNYCVFLQGLNSNNVKLEQLNTDNFVVSGAPGTQFIWKMEAERLHYQGKRFNQVREVIV